MIIDKIIYDSGLLFTPQDTLPVDESTFDATLLQRGFAHMNGALSDYLRCQFEFTINNGPTPTIKTFYPNGDKNTLLQWMNANIPNSGGNITDFVTMTVYDNIDTSVPPVKAINGLNGTFSSLKGRSRYKFRVQSIEGVEHGLRGLGPGTYKYTLLKDIVDYYRPGSPMYGWIDSNLEEVAKCFWLPTNYKKYDGEVIPHTVIQATNDFGGSRNVYNVTTGTIEPVYNIPAENVDGDRNYELNSGPRQKCVMYGIYPNKGVRGPVELPVRGVDAFFAIKDMGSRIIVYPIEYTSPVNNNTYVAFYIRPVGIDSIYINFPIYSTDYELYALLELEGRTMSIRRLSTSVSADSQTQQTIGPYYIYDIISPKFNTHVNNFGSSKIPSFRLFVRHIPTGRISKLSETSIVPKVNKKSLSIYKFVLSNK